METFFTILLVIAMIATVGVLFLGIGAFAIGGKLSEQYSNKLMRARVLAQGIAIVCFGLAVLASS